MAARRHWQQHETTELSRDSLEALLRNEIAAIRVSSFATPAECAAFAAAVKQSPDMKYYSVAKRIGYIGMAQYEYRWGGSKADYFRDVEGAWRYLDPIFERSFDAIQRFIDTMAPHAAGRVGVAEEDGFGRYFAGIVRWASEGVDLHADFAPFNSPSYAIGAIDAQLGWNFYAEELEEGGDTTVHNAPWSPAMEGDVPPKSYGLPRELVAAAESYSFRATVGDVVIFNTRNPHEVNGGRASPGHERITIGSFVGRLPAAGDLVMWS